MEWEIEYRSEFYETYATEIIEADTLVEAEQIAKEHCCQMNYCRGVDKITPIYPHKTQNR